MNLNHSKNSISKCNYGLTVTDHLGLSLYQWIVDASVYGCRKYNISWNPFELKIGTNMPKVSSLAKLKLYIVTLQC